MVNPFLTEVSPLQQASYCTAERPATVSQQETPAASLIVGLSLYCLVHKMSHFC